MDAFFTGEGLISLFTLTLMEVVLGIDNIVFLSILTARLPAEKQGQARMIGLGLALGARLGLLFAISWVMGLDKSVVFTMPLIKDPILKGPLGITGKDLVLLGGGLFLIAKSTHEIYDKLEGAHGDREVKTGAGAFGMILLQIVLLDLVFSLDSVITAVGMAQNIPIMIVAMVIAVGVMLVFAGKIGDFVNRHPSVKILALSFLLLIGVMLVADGFHQHIGKGYIYCAMAFSLLVELLNMRFRKKQQPVHLHADYEENPVSGIRNPEGTPPPAPQGGA
jgi:predicted tellurium resistance membrane protein TerC